MKRRWVNLLFCLAFAVSALVQFPKLSNARSPDEYWPSSECRNCHRHIYEQQSRSMHEKSFTNPVFQAQYFEELLPAARKDPGLLRDAKTCIACHSPVSYQERRRYLRSREDADSRMSGVTCDFCHTISGYTDDEPGSGNYIASPGMQKLGPFKQKTDWHHVYSELQTKSEFCGICHNAVNRHGLEVKSTFTEWKESPYASRGIQCQDCHMNVQGFLSAGKPVYESGKAAEVTLARPADRAKLYTHHFPGARTRTQIAGALSLTLEIGEDIVSPGDRITVRVLVDNSRTGHKMPSGSADLRLLLLDVKAEIGGREVVLPAATRDPETGYDVSGRHAGDGTVLGKEFPQRRRIYRTIFMGQDGKQTFASYDAVRIAFDNRLDAAEIRAEVYTLRIPEEAKGRLSVAASLYYFPYPKVFAAGLGLPEPEAVEVASVREEVPLKP